VLSLLIGNESTLGLGETTKGATWSSLEATASITNHDNLVLFDSTIDAPRLNNIHTIESHASGESTINSAAFQYRQRVDDLGNDRCDRFPGPAPGWALSGGTWAAINNSSILLPGSISDLAAGDVDIVGGG
jgi:hypothetical protein